MSVPDRYPNERVQLKLENHNFPASLAYYFISQAQEYARQAVEPPLSKLKRYKHARLSLVRWCKVVKCKCAQENMFSDTIIRCHKTTAKLESSNESDDVGISLSSSHSPCVNGSKALVAQLCTHSDIIKKFF